MRFVTAIAIRMKRMHRGVRHLVVLARGCVKPPGRRADAAERLATDEPSKAKIGIAAAAPARDADEVDVLALARLAPTETSRRARGRTARFDVYPASDEVAGPYLIRVDLALNGRPSIRYAYPGREGAERARILQSLGYVHHALHGWLSDPARPKERRGASGEIGVRRVHLDAGDTAALPGTVGYDRARGDGSVHLIPDVHFYMARGYDQLRPDSAAPNWNDRRPQILWRGSTTGGGRLSRESIAQLPRYRLCVAAQRFSGAMDVGFTNVVQSRSDEDAQALQAHLSSHNIWRDRMERAEMAQYRYVIDIDGNAGSWGLFEKLLMGACVLKVSSLHEQWFHPDLKPWVHYVPLESDLSDLDQAVPWCFEHASACQAIGEAGRAFALERDFEGQMSFAARTIAAAARPL